MPDRSIRLLDPANCTTIVVRPERLESLQWAGLAIPTDVPANGVPFMRRRMIIARTPSHA